MTAETNTDRTSTLKRMVAGKLSAIRERKALATPAPAAPVAVSDDVRRAFSEATDMPLFVHDFADPVVSSSPTALDVHLSFTTPDHITAAFMGEGMAGTIEQARKDATALAAAWNHFHTLLSAPSATRPEAGERDAVILARAAARRAIFGIADGPDVPWDPYQSVVVRAGRVESEILAALSTPRDPAPASPPPASVSAPTEEGLRSFADQQSREFVEACDQAEATALSPDTDTAGREGWQPIETAPKDQGEIQVWVRESGEQFVVLWDEGWVYANGPFGTVECDPDMWRPTFPAPPVRSSKAEG